MYTQAKNKRKYKRNSVSSPTLAESKTVHQNKPFSDNRPEFHAKKEIVESIRKGPVARGLSINNGRPVQLAWNTDQVNTVLDKDEAGRNSITALNAQGYRVMKFSGGTYWRQYYEDAAKTIKDGEPEQRRVNGWHRRSEKLIAVRNDKTPELAASTLVHEVAHANQHQANEDRAIGARKPFPNKKAKEYDAHIRQDHFNKAAGIDPKKPEFRDEEDNVNEAEIKKYVDRAYAVGSAARFYTNLPKEYGVEQMIKPWPAIVRDDE